MEVPLSVVLLAADEDGQADRVRGPTLAEYGRLRNGSVGRTVSAIPAGHRLTGAEAPALYRTPSIPLARIHLVDRPQSPRRGPDRRRGRPVRAFQSPGPSSHRKSPVTDSYRGLHTA